MEDLVVVLMTAPDDDVACSLGRTLVEERLAACVNILGGVRSIYRWKGSMCDDSEVSLWVKTRRELLPRLQERVRSLHPYDVPEIIALPIIQGFPPYLAWVWEETGSP